MIVKFCGMTSLADARFAAGAGADMIGFIQHANSPRYVDARTAGEIGEWLSGPTRVGVFADLDADDVLESIDTAGFEAVQLHGSESAAYCALLPVPVIKAFPVGTDDTAATVLQRIEPYLDVTSHILLDAAHDVLYGGTGTTLSWDVAAEISSEIPIILAGGLHPENVLEAIERVKPQGVDVSSGIEMSPGVKDFDLITAFMEQIR